MSDISWHHLTKTSQRWVQFLGWFLAIEFFANVVVISTVSGIGWDNAIRNNRLVIQLVAGIVALAFALYQAFSRSVTGWIGARVRPLARLAERNEHLLGQVEKIEFLLAGSQAEAERAAEALREAEEARAAALRRPNPVQQLASLLQTVIAANQVERQSAHLWRCHRTARGELVCTLPVGRRHGISEGVQFTVIDSQEGRPIGRFRVTGTADTFAACTLIDGGGWLQAADQYADNPLPPHALHFSLPDAAYDIDVQTADRMLRLLAAVAPPDAPAPQPAMTRQSREVMR
jgi:hypothetical protein